MRLKEFKAEVKKQMYIRDWRRKELAEATGVSVASIDAFFCGTRFNDKLAESIAGVLGIDTGGSVDV